MTQIDKEFLQRLEDKFNHNMVHGKGYIITKWEFEEILKQNNKKVYICVNAEKKYNES